jgi:tRNA threonylcarbamoyladenosine biosynthesis protein TsaE
MPAAARVLSRHLADEAATLAFAGELLIHLQGSPVVFLEGQLGAGKTTLVRGILRALGHEGSVKSPTYTLLEPYEVAGRTIYHFDLYRIGDSEELDFIGFDELLDADALKLIEWPERGAGRLPVPDVRIRLSLEGEGRHVEVSVQV